MSGSAYPLPLRLVCPHPQPTGVYRYHFFLPVGKDPKVKSLASDNLQSPFSFWNALMVTLWVFLTSELHYQQCFQHHVHPRRQKEGRTFKSSIDIAEIAPNALKFIFICAAAYKLLSHETWFELQQQPVPPSVGCQPFPRVAKYFFLMFIS